MSEVKVQGEVSQTLFEYLHMEILSHLIESYGNEKKVGKILHSVLPRIFTGLYIAFSAVY